MLLSPRANPGTIITGPISYDEIIMEEPDQTKAMKAFFGPEITSNRMCMEALYTKTIVQTSGNCIPDEMLIRNIPNTEMPYLQFEALVKAQSVPRVLLLDGIGDGTKLVVTERATDNQSLTLKTMSAEKLPLVLMKTPLSPAAAQFRKEWPNFLVSRYIHRSVVADVAQKGKTSILTWFIYPGPEHSFWSSPVVEVEHEFLNCSGRMICTEDTYTMDNLVQFNLKLSDAFSVTVLFLGGFPKELASLLMSQSLQGMYSETCTLQ